MTDFSTDALAPSWVQVGTLQKGDLPGHEFHGNQYSGGGGAHWEKAAGVAQLATRVRDLERAAGDQSSARDHGALADRHAELGNEMNSMARQAEANGHTDSQIVKDSIRGARLAADTHFAAAAAHNDISTHRDPYSAGDRAAKLNQAEALSHVAAMASNRAMELGQWANGTH
jgi:hypothetical protein